MKPENESLKKTDETIPSNELDVTMLTKEVYEIEKEKKQKALIDQAKKQESRIIVSQPTQELKIPVSNQLEDYLLFFNEILDNYNIAPLNDEEISQINGLVNDIGKSLGSLFNKEDPQKRSFIKDATLVWKSWKTIKKMIYPRIEPHLGPLKEKSANFFKTFSLKEYFKTKKDGGYGSE